MGNQNRQGFHSGSFSGYQQGGNLNQNQGQGWKSHLGNQFNKDQGQGWRSHLGNQFNKDQGGPSNRPLNQGPNLYERTTKLEETLAQFMQVSMSNHKSTESAIKNLEIQVELTLTKIPRKNTRLL